MKKLMALALVVAALSAAGCRVDWVSSGSVTVGPREQSRPVFEAREPREVRVVRTGCAPVCEPAREVVCFGRWKR